jgi:hypothetical protein
VGRVFRSYALEPSRGVVRLLHMNAAGARRKCSSHPYARVIVIITLSVLFFIVIAFMHEIPTFPLSQDA